MRRFLKKALSGLFQKRSSEKNVFPLPWNNDPVISGYRTPDVISMTELVRRYPEPSDEDYLKKLEELRARAHEVTGQTDYIQDHSRRFHELIRAVCFMLSGKKAPVILDVGVSLFSCLYRCFIPDVFLITLDRPVPPDYPGFRCDVVERLIGSNIHIELDHEHPELALYANRIDLVVFTEVLEHLDAHPVPLLESFRNLLAPDGWLYLTTPNFFRKENLIKLMNGENPLPCYPPGDGNWDAHHHHREYTMKELLTFATSAGLEVRAFYASDCWDSPDDVLPEEHRSNLVLILCKPHFLNGLFMA